MGYIKFGSEEYKKLTEDIYGSKDDQISLCAIYTIDNVLDAKTCEPRTDKGYPDYVGKRVMFMTASSAVDDSTRIIIQFMDEPRELITSPVVGCNVSVTKQYAQDKHEHVLYEIDTKREVCIETENTYYILSTRIGTDNTDNDTASAYDDNSSSYKDYESIELDAEEFEQLSLYDFGYEDKD